MAGAKGVSIVLPEIVPSGSQFYKVVIVDHFPDDGACDRGSMKMMWIEDNPTNPRELFHKFWHEVLHGGEKEYGYQLKDDPWDSDVDRIAHTINQAFFAVVEAA